MERNTIEKIMSRLEPITESGCWVWHGSWRPDGYVMLMYRKKNTYLHRVMYEHFVGAIPPKKQIDHLCRVRACGNPAHFEVVTNQENVIRGNKARGQATHCARGHDYATQVYLDKNGGRHCRTCHRAAVDARDRRYPGRCREKKR